VVWVDHSQDQLRAIEALELPSGDGYVRCAAEAKVAAKVRELLVVDKGHGKHAIRASAYWKDGSSAHHEKIGEDYCPSKSSSLIADTILEVPLLAPNPCAAGGKT
jgi:hypothetical protein